MKSCEVTQISLTEFCESRSMIRTAAVSDLRAKTIVHGKMTPDDQMVGRGTECSYLRLGLPNFDNEGCDDASNHCHHT